MPSVPRARTLTTRPGFWIALGVVSLASALGAWRYFPDAFSIVSLDISMTRELALAEARVLAERDGLGPAVFRQAASFSLDTTARCRWRASCSRGTAC